MSIRKYYFAFLVFFICSQATAQSVTVHGVSLGEEFEKRMSGRFNFLGILDSFDENISIGAEYKFHPHWSVGSDVAYIFYSLYLSESKHARGFIVRPFIRYYPRVHKEGFFEAGLHYKYVAYQITDWVGKDVVNGVPAYEEYATFNYNKNVFAINVRAGSAVNLSRDKKWKLEFYAGLGVRFKNQKANIGEYRRQFNSFIRLYDSNYSAADIPAGIRLVCDIR